MSNYLRIVVAQLNFTVGDIQGNTERIIDAAHTAQNELLADLIVFPELALTGYPPEDLLLRSDFHQQIDCALERLEQELVSTDIILGFPQKTKHGLYNAAGYIHQGKIQSIYHKQHLPNYGVFDEKRYFTAGRSSTVISCKGVNIGLTICEDLWQPGPCKHAIEAGAELIISINASPFDMHKSTQREETLKKRCVQHNVPIIYAHCIGGQDEVVFDGGSMTLDANGTICQHADFFKETLMPIDIDINNIQQLPKTVLPPTPSPEKHVYDALTLGIRDYVQKNGFNSALLGLSGGIDSALTLVLIADALGPEAVEAVIMPSRYTAQMSIDDAIELANNLNAQYSILSIEPVFEAFLKTLHEPLKDTTPDQTEENIQARCRAVLLMAISNKTGKMLITTSNKSEAAVGYTTLYGDMAGGFAPIKDLPKTWVYRLARYRNQLASVIPVRTIERPPTAELRHDQTDQDSLPHYDDLDVILERYVEQDQSVSDIVKAGFDETTVREVIAMVDRNEYKRRQSAPGIRITSRAFGRDRRYPITSGFTHTHFED